MGSVSNTISKPISISDEEFSNDTSLSVAQKILNEIKDTIVTLQRVVQHRMNGNVNNLSSPIHQEFHKIFKDEIVPIVNQVDSRVQNFKNHFLKEAAKFVREFKSLAKEADSSLDKITVLEKENKRLLRAVVSQDIMSIVQSPSVVETSELQTELEPYNNMQHQVERLQAQLGDLKGIELYSVTPLPKSKVIPKVVEMIALSKPVTSNSAPSTKESKVVKKNKVIAPGMFRINPFKTSRVENYVPNKSVKASVRTKPITTSQPYVITMKDVNSDLHGLSSTGLDNTTKTRRPQPRSNTKNDRVPSASKSSCIKNKEVKVEEHHRNLLLSKNQNICHLNVITYVNDMNSHDDNQHANVLNVANQKKHKPKVKKSKKLGSKERLASPKPRKPRTCLRWSPTRRFFGCSGKLIASSDYKCQSDNSKGDNACASNPQEPTRKRFQNSTSFLGRVYYVEGLGHNLFSVGQFCDLDLEVAFRRNTCFVRNLKGVDLLKGNHTTNLYTINLHEMSFSSLICLIARATSTKSCLKHQRLSHLNFVTINELVKNDLVTGLPKFKYHKEHLCSSCEQGKSKASPYKPKPAPNSKQRLHFIHMDLCGLMRVKSINGKRYVLVIVDDYSRYTWVHFLRSKDKAPEEIKTFLKKIQVLLKALVIIVRTKNGT
ncbi:retrovirus-related pol polyprotein from transposon TNT 1-94 [Tanacetum coccineum]